MTAPRLSHQECWELLPWHSNGALAPDEAARVDEHLAGCAICREEIRACREMAVSLTEAPAADHAAGAGSGFDGDFGGGFEAEPGGEAAVDATAEAGLARVMARIDAAEAVGSAGAGAGRRRNGRWRALAATPRPVRWLLAAQAAALVAAILGTTALRPGGEPDGPLSGALAGAAPGAFHTLSDPAPPGPAAGEPRVRVVFADGAAAAAVRDLLLAAGARMVDGPTPFGVYTVEALAPGGGRDRGAELLLARLRADPAVVFAEPALAMPSSPTPSAPAAPEPRAEAAP
jgi:hypothetical protein